MDEITPTLDTRSLSLADRRKLQKLQVRAVAIERELNDDDNPPTLNKVDELLEKYEALRDQIDAINFSIVVDLPREWLVDNAPDDIDWSDLSNIQWLRADRQVKLDIAIAKHFLESSSGN